VVVARRLNFMSYGMGWLISAGPTNVAGGGHVSIVVHSRGLYLSPSNWGTFAQSLAPYRWRNDNFESPWHGNSSMPSMHRQGASMRGLELFARQRISVALASDDSSRDLVIVSILDPIFSTGTSSGCMTSSNRILQRCVDSPHQLGEISQLEHELPQS
jgi:hypothetical protein